MRSKWMLRCLLIELNINATYLKASGESAVVDVQVRRKQTTGTLDS
jgi:hypothetical protein